MAVFKTNDNVEIYYEVRGEGRPLFLLPGWTCTTKFWQKNVEELSKGCKVIAMDMRDHTNLDWRDFIPNIKLPTLVCVARNSNVFDWHGSAWVGENIPGAKTVFFENSGHMLFWEEPDKFNQTVAEFVKNH